MTFSLPEQVSSPSEPFASMEDNDEPDDETTLIDMNETTMVENNDDEGFPLDQMERDALTSLSV